MPKPERAVLSPFKRFENLTKGLLAVPHKELQDKIKKYKREKSKRKAAAR